MLWRRKWQPTPLFLPEKSHGQKSLVGYSWWGREWSDMTERLIWSVLIFLPVYNYYQFYLKEKHRTVKNTHFKSILKIYYIYFVCLILIAKSCLTLVTPWTIAHQALLSMGFSRQEYWSGFPFPSPGDLPNPGIEPRSPALQVMIYWLSLKEIYLKYTLDILLHIFGGNIIFNLFIFISRKHMSLRTCKWENKVALWLILQPFHNWLCQIYAKLPSTNRMMHRTLIRIRKTKWSSIIDRKSVV